MLKGKNSDPLTRDGIHGLQTTRYNVRIPDERDCVKAQMKTLTCKCSNTNFFFWYSQACLLQGCVKYLIWKMMLYDHHHRRRCHYHHNYIIVVIIIYSMTLTFISYTYMGFIPSLVVSWSKQRKVSFSIRHFVYVTLLLSPP